MVLVSQPKRPNTIHHKRRTGTHHKRTAEYKKTYWPYLPLAMLVGFGLLVNTFWPSLQNILGYATDMSISSLLQETNAQRGDEKLAALTANAKLNAAAQAKADDMAKRNYWSHNTPDGTQPWTFLTTAGYEFEAAGENLAYGFDTSDATIQAWMNSPGHRANIMNSKFQEVGFGIANVSNYQGYGEQTLVVAMYGAPSATAAASPATPQAQDTSGGLPETIMNASNDAASSQKVARIELLASGLTSWSVFAVSALTMAALGIFIMRHGIFWRRALVKGEAFIVKHPFLDIALVGTAVLGFILTRTAGSIY